MWGWDPRGRVIVRGVSCKVSVGCAACCLLAHDDARAQCTQYHGQRADEKRRGPARGRETDGLKRDRGISSLARGCRIWRERQSHDSHWPLRAHLTKARPSNLFRSCPARGTGKGEGTEGMPTGAKSSVLPRACLVLSFSPSPFRPPRHFHNASAAGFDRDEEGERAREGRKGGGAEGGKSEGCAVALGACHAPQDKPRTDPSRFGGGRDARPSGEGPVSACCSQSWENRSEGGRSRDFAL